MSATAGVDAELRTRLREAADALIPAVDGMPAASEVGVADEQLDRVLGARPDLLEPLARALADFDAADWQASLDRLAETDPEGHHALQMTVAGGYYIHPRVRQLIGYDGQVPVEVKPDVIPPYVEEGLVDHLVDRPPMYRTVPEREDHA